MALDQPFENRVRVGLSTRAWATSQPEGLGVQSVRELRFDLSASWAPTRWLQLLLTVPGQLRELESASLARQRAVGPGEVDVAARFVILRDSRLRARYLVSTTVGLQLPTSPVIKDATGAPLDVDAQLALGEWTPHLTVSNLSFLSERWAVFAAASGEWPLGHGRLGVHGAPSARLLAGAQLQPVSWLAVRAGLEGRYDAPRLVNGVLDPSGAGPALFAAPDVLFMVGARWVLQGGLRWPVASSLGGGMRPGPVFALSVVVDA